MDIEALYEAVQTRFGLTMTTHLLALASNVNADAQQTELLAALKLGMTEIVPPRLGPGEMHVSEMLRRQAAHTVAA